MKATTLMMYFVVMLFVLLLGCTQQAQGPKHTFKKFLKNYEGKSIKIGKNHDTLKKVGSDYLLFESEVEGRYGYAIPFSAVVRVSFAEVYGVEIELHGTLERQTAIESMLRRYR